MDGAEPLSLSTAHSPVIRWSLHEPSGPNPNRPDRRRASGPGVGSAGRAGLVLVGFLLLAGCGRSPDRSRSSAETSEARRRTQKILARVRPQIDRGRFDRALRLVEKAERVDSTYAWVPYLRGEIYRAMNRIERARAQYERALRLDEAHPEARMRLGDLAADEERYEEALRRYEEQWTLIQDQLDRRGWSYEELPRSSRIATQMRTVPVRRARVLVSMGQSERARSVLEEALRRDSAHAAAHYYLAQIEQDRGRTEEGLAHARRAVELRPRAAEYRYTLGTLLLQHGEPEAAVSHLQKVLEQRPRHVGAHYNLGQAYIRTGRSEEGSRLVAVSDSLRSQQQRIAQARVTARAQRENPSRWLELAGLLRRAGRTGEAVRVYRTVLALDSTNAEARAALDSLNRTP